MTTYLIDTCIWLDIIENRKGYLGEPLREYGSKLFLKIISNKEKIIVSDILIEELKRKTDEHLILSMLNIYEKLTETIFSNKEQIEEAKKLSLERNIPKGDALHAIIARDRKAILITRDRDFDKLLDISEYFIPEEII